jgi:hypothetical protein
MTLAEKFMYLWLDPTRSCQARGIVARLDSQANKTRYDDGKCIWYTFSDGSIVYNIGRGWKLKHNEEST